MIQNIMQKLKSSDALDQTDDMIMRVAIAIWHADSHPGAGIDGEDAERMARAAINAMRQPTDAMVEAGALASTWKAFGSPVTNCFVAMIDAALNPSPAGD